MWADEVTFTFADLASANNWNNGTAYTSVTIAPITLSAAGGGNNGKYYTSDNSWRMYNGGTVNITAAEGYTITEVSSTPSQTFTISNGAASLSCTATVKFTAITVTYTTNGGTPTCAKPTFTPAAGAFISAQNVSIACETEGATIYYTTDGTDPTTSSSVYSAPIAVSSTTTIKVLAKANGYNDATTSAKYTFPTTTYNNLADVVALGATTDPFILNLTNAQVLGAGSKDVYVKDATDALDFYQLGLSYTAGQMLNGKVAVTECKLYNGMPEITGIGENQIVATAGNLADPILLAKGSDATLNDYKWKFVTLKGTATGAKEVDGLTIYTNLLSFDKLIPNVDNVTATGLIIPYQKNNEGDVIPELLPTNLTYHITLSQDMVTYYAGCKLNFNGTGLTVYKAKVENGAAVLTEIENPIITKEKGLILSGSKGQTYNVPVTAANATSISSNELEGVLAETAVAYNVDTKYNYILQNGVFKKATGDKLKAGKAYLSTTYDVTATSAPELKIVIGGETTGINMVQGSRFKVNGEIYNLNGQRVAQPTKGLYIVNGKKVVIK